MPIYSATLAAIAVTAAQDVFEINAHATSDVVIRDVTIGQYSDAGDAAAEMLSVRFIRGYTVSGSGGASVTPQKFDSNSRAAVTTVERNNTTVANTGTASELISDTFNVQAGYIHRPDRDGRIILRAGERLVIRITAPADEITLNATVIFEETGLYGPR